MIFYGRSFVLESTLPPDELRARIRFMVQERLLPRTTPFRIQQIAGWAYEERDTEFTLRADPWSGRGIFGARFTGRVEAAGSGSRMVGFVREHWLSQLIVTLLLVATLAMTVAALRELQWTFSRNVGRVATISATMMAFCVLLVRFDLRVAEQMVRDGIALAQAASLREKQIPRA